MPTVGEDFADNPGFGCRRRTDDAVLLHRLGRGCQLSFTDRVPRGCRRRGLCRQKRHRQVFADRI
jgi:hypothetical protein